MNKELTWDHFGWVLHKLGITKLKFHLSLYSIVKNFSRGDSGGICISSDGYLIGMNVSTTCMPSTCHTNAISEAAVFVSKNALVGAEILVYI